MYPLLKNRIGERQILKLRARSAGTGAAAKLRAMGGRRR